MILVVLIYLQHFQCPVLKLHKTLENAYNWYVSWTTFPSNFRHFTVFTVPLKWPTVASNHKISAMKLLFDVWLGLEALRDPDRLSCPRFAGLQSTMIPSLLGYLASFLLAFSLSTLVLATFGWSLGVRRLYVRVLLKIFRVGGINFSILIFSFFLFWNA